MAFSLTSRAAGETAKAYRARRFAMAQTHVNAFGKSRALADGRGWYVDGQLVAYVSRRA